jgi:hypothetical protein
LYWHELNSEAYRSLTCEARALLIEMRSFFRGAENRVHMSVRMVMRRLGVSQMRAERAIGELLDRGFIALLEKGSFGRKEKHASVYRLTNEPADGCSIAPKDYMRWRKGK